MVDFFLLLCVPGGFGTPSPLGCPGEGVGKVHPLNFTSENADV